MTPDLAPGQRVASNMCPLVVVDPRGRLILAAGSAGASRIRTALVGTLVGVLVDGRRLRRRDRRPAVPPGGGRAPGRARPWSTPSRTTRPTSSPRWPRPGYVVNPGTT